MLFSLFELLSPTSLVLDRECQDLRLSNKMFKESGTHLNFRFRAHHQISQLMVWVFLIHREDVHHSYHSCVHLDQTHEEEDTQRQQQANQKNCKDEFFYCVMHDFDSHLNSLLANLGFIWSLKFSLCFNAYLVFFLTCDAWERCYNDTTFQIIKSNILFHSLPT